MKLEDELKSALRRQEPPAGGRVDGDAGGVAQAVAVDHPALGEALGSRRTDVVLPEHVEHGSSSESGVHRGGHQGNLAGKVEGRIRFLFHWLSRVG